MTKKKSIKTGQPEHWKLYKSLRNKVNSTIRTAKSNYYTSHIEANEKNPREVWNTINRVMSRKQGDHAINEIVVNNESVVDKHTHRSLE